MLNVRLIHLIEEALDAFIIFVVMDHYEPDLAGSYKGCDEPLIELVDGFQEHVWSLPFVLVDEIQGCMGYELRYVVVFFFLGN